MPIALAPLNQEMTIARVCCDEKDAAHLAALGLTKNAKISVMSECMGAVVVLIRGTRLALDHKIASKIFVA